MERYRTLRAYSAGGVVFRLVPMRSSDQETLVPASDLAVEVALVGRSHAGIWTLPKGTPQPFVRDQIRYQKQVRHFLMEAVGGDTALHDQEYDLVEWFPISEACRRLTYQNEVNILYQAEDVLQRWLEYQRKEGQK